MGASTLVLGYLTKKLFRKKKLRFLEAQALPQLAVPVDDSSRQVQANQAKEFFKANLVPVVVLDQKSGLQKVQAKQEAQAKQKQKQAGSCEGVYPWNTPAQATWCEDNCYHDPPNCPSSHCYCGPPDPPPYTPPYLSCQGVAPWDTPEQATWCETSCNHPVNPHCPSSHCDCTTASHVWDFRDCETGNNVADTGVIGGTTASPVNNPMCSSYGVSFDGNEQYVDITDFKFGGATSFEVRVKYNSFNKWSRIFDFSNGRQRDNVLLANQKSTSKIAWDVYNPNAKSLKKNEWNLEPSWTHVVVTVSGKTMKIYKEGNLLGTKTNGSEPKAITRTKNWLGRSAWSDNEYFDGTIAYVKMWENFELTQSDVTELSQDGNCPPPEPAPTPTPLYKTCTGVYATWCEDNCNHDPPHCPMSHCDCTTD
ncbi:hypothetical protein TrST_g11015 [Triparma strigata]|uniref:Uncharacterized protein n=1 Tax=Triparma strigata TaxID=1606541 RepID=A0A9W6ZIH7_9STRA|nr:hypothetical protein TrST_g11015 [Triparma strigata]